MPEPTRIVTHRFEREDATVTVHASALGTKGPRFIIGTETGRDWNGVQLTHAEVIELGVAALEFLRMEQYYHNDPQ